MNRTRTAAKRILTDIESFSQFVLQMKLYRYQIRPLRAIIQSVLHQQGLEFLLVFSRQSGKNEALAHLFVYLLNLYQRQNVQIVFGAIADGIGRMMERTENRLDNLWNAPHWKKKNKPLRRQLGKAAIAFLSSHPQAFSRGETAHLLLAIDEMQDQDASHIEQVFEPMRAANNATAVYIGTAKLTTDALWTKKQELEAKEKEDGIQRVFFVGPDEITKENKLYGRFLAGKLKKHGRNHPIIASEYYLEPIDGAGGLFDGRRIALMRGKYSRRPSPSPSGEGRDGGNGGIFIATIDVGGQDEATTDIIAELDNPGRDYTIATMFEITLPKPNQPGPTYRAVDVFIDHGSRHFQSIPGRPSLAERLNAWLDMWGVVHTICDKSGVGEGLTDWLIAMRGEAYVTGYQFSPLNKAALGSAFLAVIETGRFQYWQEPEDKPLSDGWWFWQQVKACRYEIKPNGRFERDLKWSVPANHKTPTPTGPQLTHDDRLLSAALIALVDELHRTGIIILGHAESIIIPAKDPLSDLNF